MFNTQCVVIAINLVQFQKDLCLSEFMQQYGTDAKCEAALIQARWPAGFLCPDCRCVHASQFRCNGLIYWQCHSCRRQTSLTSGTPMQLTRLALSKWFLGIYLMTQSRTQIQKGDTDDD